MTCPRVDIDTGVEELAYSKYVAEGGRTKQFSFRSRR